jgi:hypothetical protein
VPTEAVEAYQAADCWKDYNIVDIAYKDLVTDFEVDGIYYHVTSLADMTVEVTSGDTEYTGDVVISDTVTYSENEYTVTSIGEKAFYRCESLTSIELPQSVTTNGDYAFYDCKSLKGIELPQSLTTIGEGVFAYCTSLTDIELPASLTTISDYAFYDCESLTSIELPASVTTIGEAVFAYCPLLANIKLSASLKSIEYAAFAYCESLTNIELPASLISIGDYAFYECSSLKTVISFNPEPPTLDSTGFDECPIEVVYVLDEAVDSYKGAEGWNEFNIISLAQTGIEDAIFGGDAFGGDAVESATVYTLQGVRVKGVRTMDDVKSLTPGLYIVNGRKVFVK